jgi:hypothetical protein
MMRIGFGLNHDAEDSRPAHLNRSSGGTQVNQMVPDIVRIGVTNARIKCVTPQRVEYRDEADKSALLTSIRVLGFRSTFTTRKKATLPCGHQKVATHVATRGAVPTIIHQNGSSLRTRDVPDLSLGLIKKPAIYCYNRSGRLAGIPK